MKLSTRGSNYVLYLTRLFFFGFVFGLFLNQFLIDRAQAAIMGTSGSHSCIIRNGGLWCWGVNDYGQLGNGQMTPIIGSENRNDAAIHPNKYGSTTPLLVKGLDSGVTSVSVSTWKTCAVKNGAAYCFGRNDYGDIGDGTTKHSAAPVLIPNFDQGVQDIKTVQSHTCIIQDEGLWCTGQCVFYDKKANKCKGSLTPVPMPGLQDKVTGFIDEGDLGVCVIQDKRLRCILDHHNLISKGRVTNMEWDTSLALLTASIAIVEKNNELWGRGFNVFHSQLGDSKINGTQIDQPIQISGLPTYAKLIDLKMFRQGLYALYDNGDIWTWGFIWNSNDTSGHEFKDGVNIQIHPALFKEVPKKAKVISSSYPYSTLCIITEDNDVYCGGADHIYSDARNPMLPFTKITGLPQEVSIPSTNANTTPSSSGMNHGLEVTIPFCSSPLPQPLSLDSTTKGSSKISDILSDPKFGHTNVLFPNASRLFGLPVPTTNTVSTPMKVGQCDTSASLPDLNSYIDLSLQPYSSVLEINGRFTKHPNQSGEVRGTVVFNLYPDPNVPHSDVDCSSIPNGRVHLTLSVQGPSGGWKVVQYFGRSVKARPNDAALKKSNTTWEVSTDKIPSGSRVKFEFNVPDDTGCKARIYQARLFGVQCYPDPLDPESCL